MEENIARYQNINVIIKEKLGINAKEMKP